MDDMKEKARDYGRKFKEGDWQSKLGMALVLTGKIIEKGLMASKG